MLNPLDQAFWLNLMVTLQSVTLHTSLGDLKLEVFCEEVPRTAENFLALCASGYYNETIFHRNIRGYGTCTYKAIKDR